MSKKIIVLIAAMMALCAVETFAWGLGVEAGVPFVGNLPGNNVMLSAKFDKLPLLGVGMSFNGGGLSNIGVIADWWLIQEPLAGSLGIFVGPGAYVGFSTAGAPVVSLGGRLPIGLQIFPLKWFELFIEVAPALGVVIQNNTADFGWNIQAGAGLRFWFNK